MRRLRLRRGVFAVAAGLLLLAGANRSSSARDGGAAGASRDAATTAPNASAGATPGASAAPGAGAADGDDEDTDSPSGHPALGDDAANPHARPGGGGGMSGLFQAPED